MMKLTKVVALDPGGTTGYATGLIEEGLMKVSTGQAKWDHIALYDNLKLSAPDVIVCESFDFRQRIHKTQYGLELISREYIGVVNLYCQQRIREDKLIDLMMQKPSIIGGFYTNNVLKKDKLYRPGRDHANDACRHILHWFTFGSGFQYNTRGYEPLNASKTV
jgi:hypothetical protein